MRWIRSSKRPDDRPLDLDPAHHADRETVPLPKEDRILSLQRTAGNQAVQKLLQHSGGESIPEGERKDMEAAFGTDLNEVRIHRGEDAAELAAGADASAFTTGRDIYFAPGAYTSATLAHEISHVIQQSQAASFLPAEDVSLEHQAKTAASAAMAGRAAEISNVASVPALQRSPAPASSQATPAPADSLTPQLHSPIPSEELQYRLHDIDEAVREAMHEEKANRGAPPAEAAGRVLRNAASKLGFPKWVQAQAEALGRNLLSLGPQPAVDQSCSGVRMDANTRTALHALVDAFLRMKVK